MFACQLRRLFNIHLSDPLGSVDWGAASQQVGKLVTLFFVVSFGSSLDISAIQADLPVPIDYNAELQTVGANVACGQTSCFLSLLEGIILLSRGKLLYCSVACIGSEVSEA